MILRDADNFHTLKKNNHLRKPQRGVNSVGAQLLHAPISSEDGDGDDISGGRQGGGGTQCVK
eukprot:1143976-Pelagomonas_calceolata.AAC.1